MTDKHNDLTIHAAHELLKTKKISSVELTTEYLNRIKAVDSQVRAIVTLTGDYALEQAKKADEIIAGGKAAPLTGVPFLLKDNMATKGIKTTCSSKMLKNFVP